MRRTGSFVVKTADGSTASERGRARLATILHALRGQRPDPGGQRDGARFVVPRVSTTRRDRQPVEPDAPAVALRLGTDLSDMHRLEQLAKEARIELPPGGNRILLNGEDVTDAVREPQVGEAASKVSAARPPPGIAYTPAAISSTIAALRRCLARSTRPVYGSSAAQSVSCSRRA